MAPAMEEAVAGRGGRTPEEEEARLRVIRRAQIKVPFLNLRYDSLVHQSHMDACPMLFLRFSSELVLKINMMFGCAATDFACDLLLAKELISYLGANDVKHTGYSRGYNCSDIAIANKLMLSSNGFMLICRLQ
ncbi:hypothetical protein [Oryza sativa Japonica Group]|uniref:Uncharacterized protein n=1 Tax=Oryza sativa subsp. japonica TaxID=39947 RepID=Q5NAN7_ORYSJ|nr:hypothetical protein [Oryza sativa Japonica Group]BAD81457.1 hypothetical protein [Oryza sativa Japonica Group]